MVGGGAGLKTAVVTVDQCGASIASIKLDIEPFDFQQTLDGGQAFGWYGDEGGSFRGVLGSRVVDLSCDGNSMVVTGIGKNLCECVRRDVDDYLMAETDVAELRSVLGDEPGFGQDVVESPLIRVMRQDPWECLAAFICSQNSNIPRIKKMVASVAQMGRRIGKDDWAFEFPEPHVVAEAGESYLRSVGLGYRGKHLALTAQALASWGDEALTALREAPYHEAKEALMEFQGVGPKVADCVLAYSLDKGEAFPVDVHVRRAAIRLYGLDENVKNESVGEWARDRFGKYAAYAQLYMFRDEINRRTNGG